MLTLIDHIVRISSRRDRTEINEGLLEAMVEFFHPHRLTVYRCFSGERQIMVFACAGFGENRQFSCNAYLPERRFCAPIDRSPLLLQAKREGSLVMDTLPDGQIRLVFPIIRANRLLYLVDIVVPEDFSADMRTLLMGLVEYFGNHIALLDYGETDTLTGLFNRKTFDKHVFEVLSQAMANDQQQNQLEHRRKGSRSGIRWLAVCDIDHFKNINDSFGHLIGDEILIMFAQLMRENFRYDDQIFRFGGEEFVVVLQPVGRENVHAAFDRFRLAVESHNFSRVGHVACTIGYSQLMPNDTPSDLIDRADEALYWAKQHGRNQTACYESLVENGSLTAKTSHKGEIELF